MVVYFEIYKSYAGLSTQERKYRGFVQCCSASTSFLVRLLCGSLLVFSLISACPSQLFFSSFSLLVNLGLFSLCLLAACLCIVVLVLSSLALSLWSGLCCTVAWLFFALLLRALSLSLIFPGLAPQCASATWLLLERKLLHSPLLPLCHTSNKSPD